MLKMWLVLAVLLLVAMPVAANDAVDALKAPVAETVAFGSEVWEFVVGCIDSAEGYSVERIGGDVADATASCLHNEWKPLAGLTILGSIGATSSIGGEPKNQLVGGATLTLANVKGTKLVVGLRFTSRDISSRRVPLPEGTPFSMRYTLSTGLYREI